VNFGEKLKQLRKSMQMTQQQLAERLGVAKSVVSYYESGDRYPSYDVMIKIAKTFHVTIDYLLDIEYERTLNVSDLSEEDIAVLVTVADALRRKNRLTKYQCLISLHQSPHYHIKGGYVSVSIYKILHIPYTLYHIYKLIKMF
jgi:transcriptional regulator with XRE-family HTH domain